MYGSVPTTGTILVDDRLRARLGINTHIDRHVMTRSSLTIVYGHDWHDRACIHVDALCNTRIRHVTLEAVISRRTESCHAGMSDSAVCLHDIFVDDPPCTRVVESCNTKISHVTRERVMSRRNESCHAGMSNGAVCWHDVVVDGPHCAQMVQSYNKRISRVTQT